MEELIDEGIAVLNHDFNMKVTREEIKRCINDVFDEEEDIEWLEVARVIEFRRKKK